MAESLAATERALASEREVVKKVRGGGRGRGERQGAG